MVELGLNARAFARDSGVGDGVTFDEMLENGLALAEKSPKDDSCVLVIGTQNNGAASSVMLTCCVDGAERLLIIDLMIVRHR